MKFSIILIILLSVNIISANSIGAYEFCINTDNKTCDHQINDHTILRFKCVGYCARTERHCREFTNLQYILKPNVFNPMSKSDLNKLSHLFKKFKSNIKNCSSLKWSPTEICVQPIRYCYKKQSFEDKNLISFNIKKILVKTECPCIGDYGFRCRHEFCALNKEACDKFKLEAISR